MTSTQVNCSIQKEALIDPLPFEEVELDRRNLEQVTLGTKG